MGKGIQILLIGVAAVSMSWVVVLMADYSLDSGSGGMVRQLGMNRGAQLAGSVSRAFDDYRKYPVALSRMDMESFEKVQPTQAELLEEYVEEFPQLRTTLAIAKRNDGRLTYSDEIIPIIEHALAHRVDTRFGFR